MWAPLLNCADVLIYRLASKTCCSSMYFCHFDGIPLLFYVALAGAGQPAARRPSENNNDPLPKVPCYGDQLTRVRMAGAKDLRAGSHTPRDRVEHIYPFRFVDWHTKRSFLKVGLMNVLVLLKIILFCKFTLISN